MIKYIKSNYLLYFLLIPFFKPICFQYYSVLQGVEEVFLLWKGLAVAIGFVLVFSYVWTQSKLPKLILPVLFFELVIVMSTVLHQGDFERAVIDALSVTIYTSILMLGLKYNGKGIVHVISRIMGVLLICNVISVLCYPSGLPADLYTNSENPLYFMVIDNGSALFLVFSIVLFAVDGMIRYGSLRTGGTLFILAALLNAVLSRSATAILVVALICIALLFIFMTDFSRRQNPIVLFVLYAAVFLYLITMQDNIVSEFVLEKIFNRSSTFTGRYYLWESAVNMIREHLWFGYGRNNSDYISAWGGYVSSHNYVLEILLQGGIAALACFIMTVGLAVKKSLYTAHKRITACIIFGVLTILLAALMESAVHSVYIFGCIALCGGSWYLEQERRDGSRNYIKRYHSDL